MSRPGSSSPGRTSTSPRAIDSLGMVTLTAADADLNGALTAAKVMIVDRGASGMSDEQNELVAQHLRDLGYIE